MIKNVILKKILKESVFRIISLLNKVVPKRDDIILLYSGNKGISFNLLPLKRYLLNNGYDKNNLIVCGIEDSKYADDDNCRYVDHLSSIFYYMRAKHVFYTAGQLPIKPSKTQCVLHLQHGISFKTCGSLTKINNGDEFYFTACIATSDIYKPIYSKAFKCDESNIIINSEPVTDIFWGGYFKYDLGTFDKILLWTPTFRQSDYLGYDDSTIEELLPAFKEDDYEELNGFLAKLNFKLIVKIHPSQDLSRYKKLKFSNLEILSNKDFEVRGMELYNLLPQVDLLIADYSSIFLQFLLLDKPICFVIPDIDVYGLRRGFVFDDPESYMPGKKIKSKEEFYDYILEFAYGKDEYKNEREKVKKIIHKYRDGKSCERLIGISEIIK